MARFRYGGLFLFIIFLVYTGIILTTKNPPAFVDYPDWVYQGVLFHRVLALHPVPGYGLKTYPIPNSLTTIGIGLLNTFVPWQWAGKLWICFYFGLAFFATIRLSRALHINNNYLFLLLPGTVFLNLNFWYGHINFEFGVCVLLVFLAVLLEDKNRYMAYALLLILLFFIHMEACACGVLLFCCFCLDRKRKRLLLLMTPVFLLTVWYVFGRFTSSNVDGDVAMSGQYRYGSLPFGVLRSGLISRA